MARKFEAMNKVVVAPRNEAARGGCIVGSVNWVSIDTPTASLEVSVQLRYRSRPVKAFLTPMEPTDEDDASERPHRCSLEFEADQFSITPGQAAVFYDSEILLGGGLIQAGLDKEKTPS